MIKRDILEELGRDQKFLEMELAGLAQNSVMSYKEKIEKMKDTLNSLAVVRGTYGLLDVYFPEQKEEAAPQQAPAPTPEPVVEQPKEEPVVAQEAVKEEVKGDESPFPKIN